MSSQIRLGFNVEEYVTEVMRLREPGEPPPSARDIGEAISEIVYAQGLWPYELNTPEDKEAMDQLEEQVRYYVGAA